MAGSSLIGNLAVNLSLETAAFQEGLTASQKALAGMGKRFGAIGESLSGVGKTMSLAISAPFAALVGSSIPAAKESAQAIGQVNAALASMGPVAGRTAEQLQANAAALMNISTFDDDEILAKVTANMLTFGNISGAAFDRAQQAAVNLSARLGQDLQSSAIQVGKALNDPIKGITALARVGVSFTEQQKDQIKQMVAVGDVAGAQAVILGELERQYGGAAKAMRDASPEAGILQQWAELQERIGAIALQVLPPLINGLESALKWFNDLSPGMQSLVVGSVAAAAALGPLLTVLGSAISIVGALLPVFAPVVALIGQAGLVAALGAAASAAAPFIAAGAALAATWVLFGDKIGPVLTALKTKFAEALGPRLQQMIATISDSLSALWNGPLGEVLRKVIGLIGELAAAFLSAFGQATIAILSAAVEFIGGLFRQLATTIQLVAQILTGDWAGAWKSAVGLVSNAVNTMMNVIGALAGYAPGQMQKMVEGVRTWLVGKLDAVWTWVTGKIEAVKKAFFGLYDAVVGHSYIPDMVDEIGQNIGRLQGNMVDPIARMTQATADSFRQMQDGLTVGIPPVEGVLDQFAQVEDASEETSTSIVASWDQMADGVLRSLDRLVGSIKGGGFLDILSSVIDLIVQIGSTGLFGSNFAAASKSFGGARAAGGPVVPGKTYLVGEKGPEWFTPQRGGTILPNGTGAGGGVRVEVVPSPYFDVTVDQRAGRVAAPMATQAGMVSSQMTEARMQRRARNRIPG